MKQQIEYNILLFFVCAIVGWVLEVACKYIQYRRLINRGFLIGPYCPIYGCGAVIITTLLSGYREDPVTVFALSVLLCGILEYVTSYVMEKLFHARWWDYSHKPFNLNGRVCLSLLLPFGLMGLVLVYAVQPRLFALFAKLPEHLLSKLCGFLMICMVADVIISARVLSKIRSSATNTHADSTEALTEAVRNALTKHGILTRRTLRAYPAARLYNRNVLEKLKKNRERLAGDAAARRQRIIREIDRMNLKPGINIHSYPSTQKTDKEA